MEWLHITSNFGVQYCICNSEGKEKNAMTQLQIVDSEWVKLKLQKQQPNKILNSLLFLVFAFPHSLILNTTKMGLVSQDALNQLQALMDQGLPFITSSLSFFIFLSPLFLSFLFSFFFIELFLSDSATWGGATAENVSGDHFSYTPSHLILTFHFFLLLGCMLVDPDLSPVFDLCQ